MKGQKIRDGLDKTEYEKNGWKIVILEYNNKFVKGRYQLGKWKDGFYKGLDFETYRKNFIEELTKTLINKIIPDQDDAIFGDEEDFGI